jgi:hypothetical protein
MHCDVGVKEIIERVKRVVAAPEFVRVGSFAGRYGLRCHRSSVADIAGRLIRLPAMCFAMCSASLPTPGKNPDDIA